MSLQQPHIDLIAEVVAAKTTNGEMFTAYDVSKEVQDKAKAAQLPFVRHNHMKGTVHDTVAPHVDSGDYEKDQQHDVGATTPAILYYPAGSDPNDYVSTHAAAAPAPSSGAPASSVAASLGVVQPDPDTDDDDEDDDDSDDGDGSTTAQNIPPDQRGRVCAPNSMTHALGWKQGDTIHVDVGTFRKKPCLILSKTPRGTNVVDYTVDKNDNVRVHDHALAQINLKGATVQVTLCQATNEIIIHEKD